MSTSASAQIACSMCHGTGYTCAGLPCSCGAIKHRLMKTNPVMQAELDQLRADNLALTLQVKSLKDAQNNAEMAWQNTRTIEKARQQEMKLRDDAENRLLKQFDMRAHLAQQAEWSRKTFGPGLRTKGVIDHIRSELDEILADPTDLVEWIDVVILALDGAWRAGYTPDQIIEALANKQMKNQTRKWPDYRTVSEDTPIFHVKTEKE